MQVNLLNSNTNNQPPTGRPRCLRSCWKRETLFSMVLTRSSDRPISSGIFLYGTFLNPEFGGGFLMWLTWNDTPVDGDDSEKRNASKDLTQSKGNGSHGAHAEHGTRTCEQSAAMLVSILLSLIQSCASDNKNTALECGRPCAVRCRRSL